MAYSAAGIHQLLVHGLRRMFGEDREWHDHNYPHVPANGVRWTQMYHEELSRVLAEIMTGRF